MKKQGVELYRFIMTIIICLHHFRLYAETTLPYGGGYLAVDFFFILSGYIIMYILLFREDMNMMYVMLLIAKLFMVDGIFVQTSLNVMPQGWYCSVLWVGSTVVYFLIIRYGEGIIKRAMLFISAGIYLILFWRYAFLNLYTQYGVGISVGFFRGIAG